MEVTFGHVDSVALRPVFHLLYRSFFIRSTCSPKLMIVTEWTIDKQLSILIHPNNSPEPFTLTYERSKVIIKPIPNLYTMNFSQNTPSPKLMIVTEWTLYKQLSILIHPNNSPEPFTLTYERSKVIIKPIPSLDTQF